MNKENYWKEENHQLVASWMFADFNEAFRFITGVALIAESQGHHPVIWNVYNKVELRLSTHDAGDVVTEKDHKLAAEITRLYSSFRP